MRTYIVAKRRSLGGGFSYRAISPTLLFDRWLFHVDFDFLTTPLKDVEPVKILGHSCFT